MERLKVLNSITLSSGQTLLNVHIFCANIQIILRQTTITNETVFKKENVYMAVNEENLEKC